MQGPGDETPSDEKDEPEGRIEELDAQLRRREEVIGHLKLQLEVLSTVDGATGLLNRNGIVDSIETALHRLERQREPFAVVALRIPALAEVARRHPDSLEESLQHFAALMTAGLRALDRCGLLDENTLIAVTPLVIEADVPVLLGRLKSIFEATPIEAGGEELPPSTVFAVVLVQSGRPAEVASILALLEEGLTGATPEDPAVIRV